MTHAPDILCIGAAHWDVIGRSPHHVAEGTDLPGEIRQSPGGVALNVARALARMGHRPALLSAIGQDAAGDALVALLQAEGIETAHLHRPATLTTDRYLCIEGAQGLVAAIADSATLERSATQVLAPIGAGRLASWRGTIILDSGLPQAALAGLAHDLAATDLRLTSAAPAKAARLAAFLARPLARPGATFYLNRAEASALLGRDFADGMRAAQALVAAGAARAIVTDGAQAVADVDLSHSFSHTPARSEIRRVTGAGDVFMASHIAAEARGQTRDGALKAALDTAAQHISTPHA